MDNYMKNIMEKVVIEVSGGVAEVRFASDFVETWIFDRDNDDRYTLTTEEGEEIICLVIKVNDDGTVDLISDEEDGESVRYFNIPVDRIEFYGGSNEI